MRPETRLYALGPVEWLNKKVQGRRQETTSRDCRSVSLALQSTEVMMNATNREKEFAQLAYAEGVIYGR